MEEARAGNPVRALAEFTITKCLSDYQMSRKATKLPTPTREMPNQLAVGIAMRQAFRSKKMIDLLSRFGMTVDYERLLRLETQVATSAQKKVEVNGGL